MVSLLELAEITEEGVKFKSPYDGRRFCIFLFAHHTSSCFTKMVYEMSFIQAVSVY